MFRRLLFGLIASWWSTSLLFSAIEITRGPVVELTPTNAIVRWSTDHATGTRIYYGADTKHLETRVDPGTVSSDHEVQVNGLKPGVTYWYSVGTARVLLGTNSFTTPGVRDERGDFLAKAAGGKSASPVAKPNPPSPGTVASVFDASILKVPPARLTWGAPRSLQDHFDRHGGDFNAQNPEDYAAKAWVFLRRATAEGLPAKLDEDGVLRVYEPKSKTFAAYNRDLTTKTYFKPGRPNYFDDQPGRAVDLKKLVK